MTPLIKKFLVKTKTLSDKERFSLIIDNQKKYSHSDYTSFIYHLFDNSRNPSPISIDRDMLLKGIYSNNHEIAYIVFSRHYAHPKSLYSPEDIEHGLSHQDWRIRSFVSRLPCFTPTIQQTYRGFVDSHAEVRVNFSSRSDVDFDTNLVNIAMVDTNDFVKQRVIQTTKNLSDRHIERILMEGDPTLIGCLLINKNFTPTPDNIKSILKNSDHNLKEKLITRHFSHLTTQDIDDIIKLKNFNCNNAICRQVNFLPTEKQEQLLLDSETFLQLAQFNGLVIKWREERNKISQRQKLFSLISVNSQTTKKSL